MSSGQGNRFAGFAALLLGYAALSFVYSFLAFLSPAPRPSHLVEYTLATFIIEVGGHFLFALIAALPLLDPWLILLVGCMGIAIDTDHILAVLGFQVSAQPSHSLLFASIATLFAVRVAKQMKGRIQFSKVAVVVPVAIVAHISYDVYAAYNEGAGRAFPLLLPFSFLTIQIPYSAWPLLELAALATAIVGSLLKSRSTRDTG